MGTRAINSVGAELIGAEEARFGLEDCRDPLVVEEQEATPALDMYPSRLAATWYRIRRMLTSEFT